MLHSQTSRLHHGCDDPHGSCVVILFVALAFCFSSAAWATDFYVVPGGAGTRDGTSWSNALGDVQAAIDACATSGGGTVKIVAGTYKPTSQPNLVPSGSPAPSPAPPAQLNHFSLRNNVKVWGGYRQSSEIRIPQLYPTILSGDLVGNDKDSDADGFIDTSTMDDNCRVFYHPPWATIDSTAQLDGVTISGGYGRENIYYYTGDDGLNGGGMFNAANISPATSNCVFRDNFSEGNGGAFYKEGSYSNPLPILDRCTFVANKAGQDGGAAFFNGASAQVVNCTFLANAASDGGGATYTSGGSISFTNCTVVNNRAGSIGGIYSSASITNCILWGNADQSYPTSQQLSNSYSVSNSIVQGGYSGTGNLDKDPLLLPLNNYGGGMATMALRGDSPAIDKGTSNGAPIVDERGAPRDTRDIGAYEYRLTKVIYVKAGGTGDGTSWANASGNLASAILSAPNSSAQTEIWVAEGTYIETITLRSYVSVYGGFSGVETKLSERDIAAHPTILSADLNGDDADLDGDGVPDSGTSENAAYVCSNSVGGQYPPIYPSAMLDGFVLSGARTAAIWNKSSSPGLLSSATIANCTFRYNAGVSVQNDSYSAPRILNCTFHHNAANREAIVNSTNGVPVVVNCTFSGSSSMWAAPIISNQTQISAAKFFNCTFSVGAYQTAISNASSTSPTIRNCIIWGNSIASGIQGGSPVVSRCVIQGGYGGSTNIFTQDPKLMPLGNYGGPTLTMPVFALSSAISLVPELTSGWVDAPYSDQRGFTRDSQPDIGACEWQQNYAVIQTKEGTDRYAIGTRAILHVVSESYDLTQMSGFQWQWYVSFEGGPIGGAPIDGATQSSHGTPPLTADTSYFVDIYGPIPRPLAAKITLKAYAPNVIHVSTTGDDANDGTTWSMAKRNLQSAMDASKSGDHIWVASGTYTNPGPTPIALRKGVSVYGGFSGEETRLDLRRGTGTILSADQLGNDGVSDPATTQDNDLVILAADQIGSSSVIDGFVFSGATWAAVVNANGSSPTISNSTFRNNPGTSVQNENSSSPAIVNCTFSANPSSSPAPIIVTQTQCSPKITNCTFAVGPTQTAIYDSYGDSSPTILNSIIWGGAAYSSAIQVNNATVSHCVIQNGFSSGTDILTEDPKLMPFGNYGGRTPTMPLSVGSPAIGQGLAGADVPSDDQRGFIRGATPDIGACEWQENFAVIRSGNEANRYAAGSTASLSVVSESELAGTIWQWYRGAIGDTSNPVWGVPQSRYVTDPLTADAAYWVRGWTMQFGPIDVGITLSVYSPHVIYVSKTGSGNGDGSSWQNAMQSLQSALAASQSGDQIWVAHGTYTPAMFSISLRSGVSVYGGFNGQETRFEERDIAAHPTILSADTLGNDADSNGDGVPDSGITENASSVCSNSGVDSSAVLDGFILSGARTAAIVNTGASSTSGSSPTISNCTFRYNLGSSIQNVYSSSPEIAGCTFHHNAAGKVVIQNNGTGSPSVVNSTFSTNPATTSRVVENQGGSPEILNCTFALSSNQTAIYNASASSPTIINCIIWGNANNSGIMNNSISAAVWHCVIQGGFTGGTNILTQDPKLLPLGNYGGATPTMPVSVGSSAINQGQSGGDILPYADQRGFIRYPQPNIDIGACEWQQQGVVAVIPEEGADRYAVGTQGVLAAFSESALSGVSWQWYRGALGDTTNPIAGATLSRYGTPPLTANTSYWVRGTNSGTHHDGGIALTVYAPNVIYVSASGTHGNGSSWQLAMPDLQSALDAAQSGDQIWVAAGTYKSSASAFTLNGSRVSIFGGFSGEETRLDQRDIAGHPTILSADIIGDDADLDGDGVLDPATTTDNAPYIFNSNSKGPAALDGFILSGATNAAIWNWANSPTIANCTFRYNLGSCVVNTYYSFPVIQNCTFHHNPAAKVVVSNSDHSSPIIVNCTFGANSATATYPTISNNLQSSPKITNCTFNISPTQSAVNNPPPDCYPTIRNSIIWGRPSSSGISGSYASVSNCVIQGGFSGGTNISVLSPQLLPLGSYGGPTPTMPLGSGSSAINAGASGSDVPYADQRGFVRDILPDIGACEFGVAVAALAGEEPGAPEAIGSRPSVTAHTDKANSAYQWFYGVKGDTSQPVPGGNSQTLSIGPLEFGSRVWARIIPGDGSAPIDTKERTFEVAASYEQWCDHHGLTGAERATGAAVAGDGVGNLLKFALGLRPRDRGSIGDRSITSFDEATSKLTQEWLFSKTPTGLTIVIEGSSDLKTWLPVAPVRISGDAGFETWKASFDTISPAKAAYLRARVTTQ